MSSLISSVIDISMLELFKIELENHAHALEEGLLELENDYNIQRIEPLMRAAHSIKGAARIVGLDIAVELSHSMEDLLEKAKKGQHILTPYEIETLLKCNDIYLDLLNFDFSEIHIQLEKRSTDIKELISKLTNPPKEPENKNQNGSYNKNGRKTTEKTPIFDNKINEIKLINKADEFLVDLFISELKSDFDLFVNANKMYQEQNDEHSLSEMIRSAHSLKGAGKIVNMEPVVILSAAVEDYLLCVQSRKRIHDKNLDIFSDILGESITVKTEDIYDFFYNKLNIINDFTTYLKQFNEIKEPVELVPGKEVASAPEPEIREKKDNIQQIDTPLMEAQQDNQKGKKIEDRFVRVLSENLNKILGLTGEILVQARLMKPFSKDLHRLKKGILELNSYKESIFQDLFDYEISDEIKQKFYESSKQLDAILSGLINFIQGFENFSRRLEITADRLYAESVDTRMKPFSEGLTGFQRMVRDIAKKLNKKVELVIKGENTKVDRDILERLESPLNHLIRNAIDHAIELPEVRLNNGKSETGTITLEARHVSGMLLVTVKDDGKGIDLEYLRNKIVERKFTTPEMAKSMSKSELYDFLFLPGFSTTSQVTEISGRGVGLDVVFSTAREIGGDIRIESEVGKGTSFIMQLPLTRSIVRSLLISVSGQPYAIPISRIEKILTVTKHDLRSVENHHYIESEGENIGIVNASQIFHLHSDERPRDKYFIVILSDRLNKYGITVDKFIGQPDLVVMPLDKRLGRVTNISSGAILEDGTPILILDVDDLVRSIDIIIKSGKIDRLNVETNETEKKKKHILIVDDSLTVREVERKLLENKGYDVTVAVDGIDGWNTLHRNQFDLIVSDVDMPRMNGIDFVKRIKADVKFKDLPVMIVSYKDREEDRILGLNAGANYYLTKSSFHDDTLISAVVDLIGVA